MSNTLGMQQEVLDVDRAIYSTLWKLPKSYFNSCKRIFLKDMPVDQFLHQTLLMKDREFLTVDQELWEVHYHELHYDNVELLPAITTLLISFRHKVYLPYANELKIALVTIKDESKKHG